MKVLSMIALGGLILVLVGALQEFFFPGPRRPDAAPWVGRVLPATLAVSVVFAMVVAYRVVRYSALPRVPILVAGVVLIWIMVFLGRLY